MGPCVISLSISLVVIVRIYALYLVIIIKSEVWVISYRFGLGHATMEYAADIAMPSV